MKSPFHCRCTKEPGDSFCMVHPTCNHCGGALDDFAKVYAMEMRGLHVEVAAIVSILGVADIPAAIDEIRRLKRIDDAAKALVSTMGAST